MTKAEIRAMIAALRPPALAFERAQNAGYLMLDDERGWVETELLIPAAPDNPNQPQLI